MTDTKLIVPPWVGEILDRDTVIPIHEPAFRLENVIRIDTLDDLLKYLHSDCYLCHSKIDGKFYLHLPVEEE